MNYYIVGVFGSGPVTTTSDIAVAQRYAQDPGYCVIDHTAGCRLTWQGEAVPIEHERAPELGPA